MRTLTRRLRILRTIRALTQRDTAIKARLPYGRYMDIENGYRVPSPEEMDQIARALKTTATAILTSDTDADASVLAEST